MGSSFKSNADAMVKALEKRSPEIQSALITGLKQGMRGFESKIIKEQMTGRPGLKRQTGTLARSWSVRTVNKTNEDAAVRLSTSTKYARIHQYGGRIKPRKKETLRFQFPDGHWVTTKSVYIPKRLYVYEDFRKNGLPIIKKTMIRQFAKVFKKERTM